MIDTHAHLDFNDFDTDRAEVVARAIDAGVDRIISIGCSTERAKQAVEIAKAFPKTVFPAVGVHPTESDDLPVIDAIAALEMLAIDPKNRIVAIGECGLDFFRGADNAERKRQEVLFRAQIDLARRCYLPLIVHSREAESDTMRIFADEGVDRAVIHCFTASLEFAEFCWARGIMTSFTGILCFPAAENVRLVATAAPDWALMLETDAPFLAPPPHRGKRCESAFMPFIAQKIAEIRGVSVAEIDALTTKNAERFFRFSEKLA